MTEENDIPGVDIDYSSYSVEEIQHLIKNKILNRILTNQKESAQMFLLAKQIWFDDLKQTDKDESNNISDSELMKAAEIYIKTKK